MPTQWECMDRFIVDNMILIVHLATKNFTVLCFVELNFKIILYLIITT